MHWGDGGRGGRAWRCGGPQSPSRCPFLPGGVGVRTAPPWPPLWGGFWSSGPCPAQWPMASPTVAAASTAHPGSPSVRGGPRLKQLGHRCPQEVTAKGLLPVKATHDDHCGGSAQTGFSNFITSWKGNKHRHLELGDTDLKASNRAEPVSARRSRARVPRRPGPRSAEGRAQGWGPSHVPTVPGWERVVPSRDTRLGRRQPLRTPGRAQTVPPLGAVWPGPAHAAARPATAATPHAAAERAARGGGSGFTRVVPAAALRDGRPVLPASRRHMLQEAGALGGVAPELLIND